MVAKVLKLDKFKKDLIAKNNRVYYPTEVERVVPRTAPTESDAMEIDVIDSRKAKCLACGKTGHYFVDCYGLANKINKSSKTKFKSNKSTRKCLILNSIESNRLELDGKLLNNYRSKVLVDSGASDNFIDYRLVKTLGIKTVKIPQPIPLQFADGKDAEDGVTLKTVPVGVTIGNHYEEIRFYVTKLNYPVIVGHPWLAIHNPQIDWKYSRVTFNSTHCVKNCILNKKIDMNVRKKVLNKIDDLEKQCTIKTTVDKKPSLAISHISFKQFKSHVKKRDKIKNMEVGAYIMTVDQGRARIRVMNSMQESVYPFMNATGKSATSIPAEIYDKFADVFSKENADKLPEHRSYDCNIDLVPDAKPSRGKIYNLTKEEEKVLQEWIQENLDKNFIRSSSSSFAAPCFFVKQKDKLRLCMDYRALNSQTVKNRYPIPLITDLIRTLSQGKIFTTLDLRGAYNLLRIKKGDEYKTAFVTKFGQYEFLVMPFGLANAPAQFQSMMNELFKKQIGNYVLVYLDDIVIYSQNREDHQKHIYDVLQILRDNKLYCKPEKCHFYQEEIKYLGYIITSKGVRMDPSKVKAVADWPVPKTTREVQKFIGFANFYRSLIDNFASLTQPLTQLLKNGVKFQWNKEHQNAFDLLKKAFQKESFLKHPNESNPFVLETDASDFAVAGILSQLDEDNVLKPVGFFSRQLDKSQRNYDIYDKELLAIVSCFSHWRHFLQGNNHRTLVMTDHKNLEFFMTTKKLTRRQARWSAMLSEYDFLISHIPGAQNRSDLLSRRPDYQIEQASENLIKIIREDQVLKLNEVTVPQVRSSVKTLHSENLNIDINTSTDWPLLIADFLQSHDSVWLDGIPAPLLSKCKKQLKNFQFKDDRLVRVSEDGKTMAWYLPATNRVEVIEHYHKNLAHLKTNSILDILKTRYWWPDMSDAINKVVKDCYRCQLSESNPKREKPKHVVPIPPVPLPFERWGVDFIQDLPTTLSGNKHIVTAIDYATRWVVAKAVPNRDKETVIKFLYNDILVNYMAPFEILTDRGNAFLSDAVEEFEKKHGIRHKRTTPYHPQTNGMVERMHSMLGHGITTLCEGQPDRWDEFLPQTLMAVRSRTHSVTGYSPFELLYGVKPRFMFDKDPPPCTMQPVTELEEEEKLGWARIRAAQSFGQMRAAAYERSQMQAKRIEKQHQAHPDSFNKFKIGDKVKLKHFEKLKFEFNWKGPYQIVDYGFPKTYWLMDPQGRRLDTPWHQDNLEPWRDNSYTSEDMFYDGTTSRSHFEGGNSVMPPPVSRIHARHA
jgi:hypothetical protein